MRTIVSLFLFLCIKLNVAYGSTISIMVVDPSEHSLKVTQPLNGTFFWGNFKVYPLGENNKLSVSITVSKAGIVDISYASHSFRMIIEPRRDYRVTIDLKNDKHPFSISGTEAEAQYLLNKIKPVEFERKKNLLYLSDSSFYSKKDQIERELVQAFKPLDSLLRLKKISGDLYGLAVTELNYFYADMMVTVMMKTYRQNKSDWDGKPAVPMPKAELIRVWSSMLDKYKLGGKYAMGTAKFFSFANNFIGTYQLRLLTDTEYQSGSYWGMKPNSHTLYYNTYTKHFKGEVLEYLLFQYLHNAASQMKYEQELIRLYDTYKASYPKSAYLPFLKPEIDKIVAYQFKIRGHVDTTQKFLPNYPNINSLSELTALFKNKVVFVDMWATWCASCKEEFQYVAELKQFLKEKNVSLLYISMDDLARDQLWKEMIRYYELSGMHIRASDMLKKDLSEKIWDSRTGGYSLPQYLIFKDGKLVERKATQPSDMSELRKQIALYL